MNPGSITTELKVFPYRRGRGRLPTASTAMPALTMESSDVVKVVPTVSRSPEASVCGVDGVVGRLAGRADRRSDDGLAVGAVTDRGFVSKVAAVRVSPAVVLEVTGVPVETAVVVSHTVTAASTPGKGLGSRIAGNEQGQHKRHRNRNHRDSAKHVRTLVFPANVSFRFSRPCLRPGPFFSFHTLPSEQRQGLLHADCVICDQGLPQAGESRFATVCKADGQEGGRGAGRHDDAYLNHRDSPGNGGGRAHGRGEG
jgi:hypothetical protein